MREAGLSDSTIAKHLRVLRTCLTSAVVSGSAGANPIDKLPKGERPKARLNEAPYFTNEELPRLFAELRDDSLFKTLFSLAIKTGCARAN